MSVFEKIEKAQSEVIRKEIMTAFEKSKELNADIFGFGRMLHKKYKNEWEKLKDRGMKSIRPLNLISKLKPRFKNRFIGEVAHRAKRRNNMNVEKGKICSMQLFFLFAVFVQGSVLLFDFAIGISESQTWMVILIGLGLAIPFVLSYVALAKRFPGMNVVQINDAVYGRFLGKTLSLYYIFFF